MSLGHSHRSSMSTAVSSPRNPAIRVTAAGSAACPSRSGPSGRGISTLAAMTMRSSMLLIAAVACARVVFAQHEAHVAGHARTPALGTIVFANSGNAAAQEPFMRGVAFLHSFEYGAAGEAFEAARRADPAFALAYWMDALTYSHMLWSIEDLAGIRAVLARLGPTPSDRLAK